MKDLKSLCEVSKIFNIYATSLLYETVNIEINKCSPDLACFPKCLSPGGSPSGPLVFTKNLHFNSYYNTDGFCAHDRGIARQPNGETLSAFENLKPYLLDVIRGLKPNTIRSFSWNLMSCVPREILGPEGYISLRQPQLQALSLITCNACAQNSDHKYTLYLHKLQHLRSLSWKAMSAIEEFDELKGALKANLDNLESLELQVFDWGWGRPGLGVRPFFVSFMNDVVVSQGPTRALTALRSLALTRVCLEPTPDVVPGSGPTGCRGLIQALNISNLSSLKLTHCLNTNGLLDAVTNSGAHLSLTSLELVVNENSRPGLTKFLRGFHGLTELYLLFFHRLDLPDGDYKLWEAIATHNSTLRRLIYHHRGMNPDVISQKFGAYFDALGNLENDAAAFKYMTKNLSLHCIGLSLDEFALGVCFYIFLAPSIV
ncbi:hypothetical protein MMC18_009496 [Xylographa bjoerkii]|nr:hypothetical protein [Xylographa bjoerkii]